MQIHGNSLVALFLYDEWMVCIPKEIYKRHVILSHLKNEPSLPIFYHQY